MMTGGAGANGHRAATAGDAGAIGFDERSEMRIDLHLHSYASGAATNWWVQSLGFGLETRESFTQPEDAYRMARQAGMDFVTLTDHETIDGALTLAHKHDFLVGEEVSAVFPEDGTLVDVLVYGLDAADHREVQARRSDVYALVRYLREMRLTHVLAHPMFEAGPPLDRAAIEKRLVLFGIWEFINGSRPAAQNRLTRDVAASVGPNELRQMASAHGLPAPRHRFIAGTAGSDDHGGIYGGHTYTVVPKVRDRTELLAALAAGEVRPGGEDGSALKMAHTGFKITAGAFAEEKTAPPIASPAVMSRDIAERTPFPRLFHGRSAQAEKLLDYLPLLTNLTTSQIRSAIVGLYEKRIANALTTTGDGFPALNLLTSLGSFVDGHVFIAPFIGVHGYFGREGQKTGALRRQLIPDRTDPLKVGVFVDAMDEIHGVATMYTNVQRLRALRASARISLVQCASGEDDGTVRLRPVATLPMPLYEGRTLGVPSLLDVLDHIADEGYEILHIATPGPLGLAALVAGITLGLPIVGSYHTEFGAYAEVLSGDALVADIVEVLVREFYQRCNVVAVPSTSTALALRSRGYQIDRFEVLKNGVDTDLFDPRRRDSARWTELGGGRTVLLYAGRVSREKGLERLAGGYRALRARRDDVHLVIAGEGPYRRELGAQLGETATFTGFLQGEELAQTFASCDIFVFPSTTDTLGRAVAEAQASGLPAVVYGMGGPRECLRPGVSGYVVDAGNEHDLLTHVAHLLDDPLLRSRMGREARAFTSTLSWENVLDGLIALYRDVAGLSPSRSSPGGVNGSESGERADDTSQRREPALVGATVGAGEIDGGR
ncbi:MAG: glycosyltransferase [Chloroflexia bacterium]|nr:glycosyltransferase [Chloroflexia bacterium]